jgi:tetratricopeptide (TPR) repeat protein
MQAKQNKGFGRTPLAGLVLSALTLTSCATKTATLHSTPYFSPTPTREATNAVDAGDGDLEIASLRKTMMARPDDVEVRLRLAQAYTARGFPDVALEHYRLAAERFPDAANAAVRLARALRLAGQKEEALAGLKGFVLAHPQHSAEPYEWLGILNDDLQNWQASQSAYETALLYSPPSSPSTAELQNNLGYALLMQHLNNAAAMEFRAALRIRHDMVIARNNLGIALAGTPKEAILNWQAVSGPAAAHNNMAALLIERGDYSEARKELVTALGYDQQNAQAVYNLALVSERDGKPAVIPPQAENAKTAAAKNPKQPGPLSRFFHPVKHTGKPVESQPPTAVQPPGLTPGQTPERPAVPVAAGSGN